MEEDGMEDEYDAGFEPPAPVVYQGHPAPGGPVVGPAAVDGQVAIEESEGNQPASPPEIKSGLSVPQQWHQLRNSRDCPPERLQWLNRLNLHRVKVAPAQNDAEVEFKSSVSVSP
jgi:hypothetical protein